jgi:hypothetical protein
VLTARGQRFDERARLLAVAQEGEGFLAQLGGLAHLQRRPSGPENRGHVS